MTIHTYFVLVQCVMGASRAYSFNSHSGAGAVAMALEAVASVGLTSQAVIATRDGLPEIAEVAHYAAVEQGRERLTPDELVTWEDVTAAEPTPAHVKAARKFALELAGADYTVVALEAMARAFEDEGREEPESEADMGICAGALRAAARTIALVEARTA